MAVQTLASCGLKCPLRDEAPAGVSWDETAVQVENSEMESGRCRGLSYKNPVLATLSSWGIAVSQIRVSGCREELKLLEGASPQALTHKEWGADI